MTFSSLIALAELTTAPITNIGSTTAASGGNITPGGAVVTARGVCWSTDAHPTVDLITKTSDGTGAGAFVSNITGLLTGTTYFVRAYATNSVGTSYGDELSFTTSAIPSIATAAVSNITTTTATSGGNITAENGAPVTAKGICWSLTSGATIDLSTKTTDGTGAGSFVSNMTGLSPGSTYFVRSYATNTAGTSYGNELNFTTPPALATIVTAPIDNITNTSASSGGNITNDGGSSITSRGVCWSTSPNPTIEVGAKTTDGSGAGVFVSSISGLTVNTTYYVRAYAVSSAGTSYGDQLSFTAGVTPHTVGESFGGGVVFYVNGTGLHGLIATTSDQSASKAWWNGSNVLTGATGTDVGTGQPNTTAIVSVQGAGDYAASVADQFSSGGFTDWYLPSKDELVLLLGQKTTVGGFIEYPYWSSSETTVNGETTAWAWMVDFTATQSHPVNAINKGYAFAVRVIRSF